MTIFHFKLENIITHGTTNLKVEELEKKYGKRVYDRMKEMFNVILWEGESFRK